MEPSEFDFALHHAISHALTDYLDNCHLVFEWSHAADMWFTTATPVNTKAATMSFAYDGTDLINVTIGNAWFELFPCDEDTLTLITEIVTAVATGNVTESGSHSSARVLIELPNRTINGGSFRLLLPSRLRRHRRYQAYESPIGD